MTTYTAYWLDDCKIIFRGKRREQVRDWLPKGTTVLVDVESTLGCFAGDEYENALFISDGRKIMVMIDQRA
jgi:hypothetical protein